MSDPDIITETDMADWPGNSPYVECELGHKGCTGGDLAENMVHDNDGWICDTCYRVQLSEFEAQESYLQSIRHW